MRTPPRGSLVVFRSVKNRTFFPQPPGTGSRRCGKQPKPDRWTKIGAAFPHKEGVGFNIELKAFPVDGRLVVLPPDGDDERNGK